MGDVASGKWHIWNAFTPLENLPTSESCRVSSPMILGDEVPATGSQSRGGHSRLYEAGVAAGGVVIMDVGINPAHVVHRAAFESRRRHCDRDQAGDPGSGAETRRWIARMINSLASVVGKGSAHEFVGSRVKLCYNQVVGDGFRRRTRCCNRALSEDKIELALIPNGIIPDWTRAWQPKP